MKKKWSSDKVKEVHRWMKKRWPESFTHGPDLRPLSLNIHKELLEFREENPQLSGRVVREVLKRHTTSFGYLYGMVKNTHRYNLDNKPVDEVSQEHRDWALQTLRKKQKLAQKARKEARQILKNQKTAAPARMQLGKRASEVLGNTRPSSPVIKYKQSRRRLIKAKTESSVELAS